ncbi:MAG: OmpH family outer membrane protein [Rhodospirillales bacterium]
MKRFLIFLFCAIALPYALSAQETDEKSKRILVKIAVIDIDEIRRNAEAVKDIHSQIGKFRIAFQSEIQKEEEALRSADQELGRQRAILTPEAFAEERRKFERRVIDYQRMGQTLKQQLAIAQNNAMGEVQKVLNEIIGEMAKNNNLTLILNRNQTIIVHSALDMTEIILKRLNERLPKVKVPEPKGSLTTAGSTDGAAPSAKVSEPGK